MLSGSSSGEAGSTAGAHDAGQHGPGGRSVPRRVLLIGGTSEIGLAILSALALPAEAEVLLAGRDADRLRSAGATLAATVTVLPYDATDPAAPAKLVADAFADGPVDLVISAAGVLIPQDRLDADPAEARVLIDTNFTSHVTALLAVAGELRKAGRGLIVILSSVAAVRPRRANFVYGAAKAGLDAFGRGLADALHGSGVRVLVVRPGFVIGRMTAGLPKAPLSATPDQVGTAVAAAIGKPSGELWVPSGLGAFAAAIRLVPRPVWRRMRR